MAQSIDIKNRIKEYRPKGLEQWLNLVAVLYVTVPLLFFFFGWVKLPIAILFSIPIIGITFCAWKQISEKRITIFNKENLGYWITVVLICAFWVYLSGIGGMVFQNGDFAGRNPAYRDLHTYSWPVIYDLSEQSEIVQKITGTGEVAFSYYFSYWLVPAFVSRTLGLSNTLANLVLYFWALLGILIVVYLLHRIIGKKSWIIVAVLIFFSGLDIIPYYLVNLEWTPVDHIEWWARTYFQYSSNTTQLFWVFNQSIPCWIITALVLLLEDNRYVGAVSALIFAYSPWAIFGIIFIAIAGSFGKEKSFIKPFNFVNMAAAAAVAIPYALFYLSANGSSSGSGFGLIFKAYPNEKKNVLMCLILFAFFETGVYFITMGKAIRHNQYYKVVLAELILFPFVYVIDWNFVMRGSIPGLFILMTYVMDYLANPEKFTSAGTGKNANTNNLIGEQISDNKDEYKLRKRILLIVLLIGMVTPLCEINRTINCSVNKDSDDLTNEEVYSFGHIASEEESRISQMQRQHFVYDYENSPFFKYIGRR